MFVFWDPIIESLLRAARPSRIVEIGAAQGLNTVNLLDFAVETGSTVHVIDPVPEFDVAEFKRKYGDAFDMHEARSLEVLPQLGCADAYLIDGDHNWYTVRKELRQIAEAATAARQPFPLVLLHDVDWPYGRRDLYYDPESIPEEHRHSAERRGLIPGHQELIEGGGLNRKLLNAVDAGTRRNGVRTAVEDFITDSRRQLVFETVPGLHGLGILTGKPTLKKNKELAKQVDEYRSRGFLAEQCKRVEKLRIRAKVQAADLDLKLKKAEATRDELSSEIGELRDESGATASQLRAAIEGRRETGHELRLRAKELRAARAEAPELRKRIKAAKRLETTLSVEKDELARRLSESEAGVVEMTGALAEIEAERDRLSERVRGAVGLEERVATLEGRLGNRAEQLDAAVRAGREAMSALAERESELDTANGRVEELRVELKASEGKLEAAGLRKRELVAAIEQRRQVQSALDEVRERLELINSKIKTRNEELEKEKARRIGLSKALEEQRQVVAEGAVEIEQAQRAHREADENFKEALRERDAEADLLRRQLRLATEAKRQAVAELAIRDDEAAKLRVSGREREVESDFLRGQLRSAVEGRRGALDELRQAREAMVLLEDSAADLRTRLTEESERSAAESDDLRQRLREARSAAKTSGKQLAAETADSEQVALKHQRELHETAVALEAIRLEVSQARESRSWRFGHGFMRLLRLLTLRTARGDGLEKIETRLDGLGRQMLPARHDEDSPKPAGRRKAAPLDLSARPVAGEEIGEILAKVEASGNGDGHANGNGNGRPLTYSMELGLRGDAVEEISSSRMNSGREDLAAAVSQSNEILRRFRKGLNQLWPENAERFSVNRWGKAGVVVGTLGSGENELADCRRSVGMQVYPGLDHMVIEGLPKKEAVATLMDQFLASKFDYMVKVDGDMVLLDRDFVARAVEILEANPKIDMLQMAILDFFSGMPMQGINAYRRTVDWQTKRQDVLFTDKSFVPKSKRLVVWSTFARSAIHSPNPSPFGAFHFGAHRGLKVLQPHRDALDAGQAAEQVMYLERTWEHFKQRRDPRLAAACLGFEMAMAGEFEVGDLDYTNPKMKAAFAEYAELDAARLEALVEERRRLRVASPQVEAIRTSRRQTLWSNTAAIRSVLFLVPHFGIYGGVNRFFELATALGELGVECAITKPDTDAKGRLKGLPDSRPDYPHVRTIGLEEALERSWDSVVCGDCTSGVMLTLPLFVTRLSAIYLLNGWRRRDANVNQVRIVEPDVVIANSAYSAKQYTDLAPITVPGGVNLDVFEPRATKGDSEGRLRVIAYGGRRKPIKRFEDVVSACELLHEQGVPVELNVYDATAFDLDLPFPWRHHGNVTPEGLRGLLARMDVMVSAEEDAGWSNPTAEAMAVGVPVVCTEAGTVDFAIDGETALVVPVGEPESIAASVKRLWEDPALAERLSQAGLERISAFGWKSVARGLVNALEDARRDGSRRRAVDARALSRLSSLDEGIKESLLVSSG